MKVYQKQLIELQQQLDVLRLQMATEEERVPAETQPATANAGRSRDSTGTSASLEEIRERQAIEESQIATHDVNKVETESKYPLKVSGLFLFSGFVNTRAVDVTAAPPMQLRPRQHGALVAADGFGARCARTASAGATSHADLRVDFFANGQQSNYAASGVLRMRTAHAELNWQNTKAFLSNWIGRFWSRTSHLRS